MKIYIYFSFFFISIVSFAQLPSEFPKNLINKVFCGNKSVCGYVYGRIDCTFSTQFDYKVFISEGDGIYVEYNPEQKFGRDKLGKTDAITSLPLWTKEPFTHKDSYGDVTGKTITYKYKVYPNYKKSHYIKAISLTVYEDGFVFFNGEVAKGYSRLYITINVPNHEDAELIIDSKDECGKLKTKLEIEQEEQERIKIENEKREADKVITNRITEFIKNDKIEEAVKEYKKLNNTDDNIANVIKTKLNEFYEKEINIYALTNSEIEGYIQNNKINLKSVPAGIYTLTFDKKGVPDNASFPGLNTIPQKNLDPFKVKLKSKATIRIEIKDSILNSVKYFSGSKKQLFIDKSENFYFKSRTGLPQANILYRPETEKDAVQIVKTYKKEKYVNGIFIDSNEFKVEKTVEIIKKDN
jgi:hypothetical protein